jgi:diamine N-acetyltransferase
VNPVFRLASENDAELLLGVMREDYAYDGHAHYEPRARTALLNFLDEPTYGRAWLICDQDTPVGYIVLAFGYSLEYLGRDAFIDEFLLVPSPLWPGLGTRRPQLRRRCRPRRGVCAIHLEVVRANTRTKEVYLRSGYIGHEHSLMSKWIERSFSKPVSEPD